MITRIQRLFDRLKSEGRAGLVGYITAGVPTPQHTARLVGALCRGGVDLIELGVPFSDPIADGPVIQRACQRALSAGITVGGVLETAAAIRSASEVPLLLFSYINPLLTYGLERLAVDAKTAGVDGVLITDLCIEAAPRHVAILRDAGLDTVFLAAPTSTLSRIRLISEQSSGFIYLVSRTGITGEGSGDGTAEALTGEIRRATGLPIAVGFGVSTPDQAGCVGAFADAVVVGTAFMKIIESASADELELQMEQAAGKFALVLRTRERPEIRIDENASRAPGPGVVI